MKNTVKHIIWSAWINEDDWRDDIREECELNDVEYDEDSLYYMAYELNSHYLEDERMNLGSDDAQDTRKLEITLPIVCIMILTKRSFGLILTAFFMRLCLTMMELIM